VLLRLGHLEEALVAYAAAVARAPHDEGALLGQAEALTLAGQRVDAAQALDHVAEVQESAGRLPEAADTLRRALELEDAPERARHQRGLLREIRLSAGDQAAEQLLARALRLRDEPSVGAVDPGRAGASQPIGRSDATLMTRTAPGPQPAPERPYAFEPEPFEPEPVVPEPVVPEPFEPEPVVPEPVEPVEQKRAAAALPDWPAAEPIPVRRSMGGSYGSAGRQPIAVAEAEHSKSSESTRDEHPEPAEVPANVHESKPEAAATSDTGALRSFEPVLAAVAVMGDPLDPSAPGSVGESQQQPTGDELLAAAEAADLAGDNTALRSLLLWTARAYAREGRFEAGLDATHRLLQRAPGDVDAHLVLVELYVARDWNALAAEKLALLGRLAELNNDEETKRRLCAVAGRVFPKDERLGALCA
jgi:tetratricopeptide (TPR) repeat protein